MTFVIASLGIVFLAGTQNPRATGPDLISVAEKAIVKQSSRVPCSTHRRNPSPKWVTVTWRASSDESFQAVRSEVDRYFAGAPAIDRDHRWARKAKAAYASWIVDPQSALKLYVVSAYLGVGKDCDPSFVQSEDFARMVGHVNLGWDVLETVPSSYEFVRRGYIFNAGDIDYHKYGDLPIRLLERDPDDRSVAIAMVNEYVHRKPLAWFESKLFTTLESLAKSPLWRHWDDYYWAVAFRMYGKKHRKRENYDVAITKAQAAYKKTPSGFDGKWILKWIEATKKERSDANFGVLAGGKYIDDIDP